MTEIVLELLKLNKAFYIRVFYVSINLTNMNWISKQVKTANQRNGTQVVN